MSRALRRKQGRGSSSPASSAFPRDSSAPSITGRPALLGVFLTALLVRLIHIAQIQSSALADIVIGDAAAYVAWAQRIVAGDWIGTEVFYQAPLYPYFLASLFSVFGDSLLAIRIVQAVVGASACLLLALAAGRMFSPRVGVIGGFLLAFYPPAIFFDGLLQKTTLDGALLCGLMWVLALLSSQITVRRALAAGILMGCLALSRENTLVFFPVVGAWLWMRSSQPAKTVVTVLLGGALVLVPVTVRNFSIDGGLSITTSQFGPNLYIGNSESANGLYVPLRPGYGSAEFERQDAIELAEEAVGRTMTAGEVSAFWRDRALTWVMSHPLQWLRLMGTKLLLMGNAVETADTEDIATYAEYSWPMKTHGLVHFGVLAPLGLLGVWLSRARWRDLWVLYALALAYAASVVAFYVFARYRFPLVPVLAAFAAVSIHELLPWWRRAALRERLAGVVVVVGAVIVCNWPIQSSVGMQAVTAFNMGRALADAGRIDEAITQYRKAIALRPDYAGARANLGGLLTMRGERADALVQLREAVRLTPDGASAQVNLGIALLSSGQTEEAVAVLEKALVVDPTNAEAHYNLGVAFGQSGDAVRALRHLREAIRIRPTYANAQNNLGALLASQGDLRAAIEHFAAAVAAEPSNAEFRGNLERARKFVTDDLVTGKRKDR